MWWYGPQYSERGHQHDYVMRASVISSSARVLAESAIALAADSPAVSLVKLSARQPKRAPTPYPVRENGTRWVGRNSTEPDGLVSPPPHARLTSLPPRADLRSPRRKRVVVVSREDRGLTVSGADSALSLNDGPTP